MTPPHQHQMTGGSNLKKEEFVLAHSLRLEFFLEGKAEQQPALWQEAWTVDQEEESRKQVAVSPVKACNCPPPGFPQPPK